SIRLRRYKIRARQSTLRECRVELHLKTSASLMKDATTHCGTYPSTHNPDRSWQSSGLQAQAKQRWSACFPGSTLRAKAGFCWMESTFSISSCTPSDRI